MEWTVKYAPTSMKDLVGNKANYNKLFTWLKHYYEIKKTGGSSKDFKFIYLLIGTPGIGKTSGINALAKELSYEIIEFNASDQRNESIITKLVGRETKTRVNEGYRGKIVLLDEVDGIQGREDRGGLSALMRVARESAHPIICTANDPDSDKIRSLKKSPITVALTFGKPTTEEMAILLSNIAQREGLTVPPKLLNVICNNSRGDIRAAVNDLENLAQERSEIPMNAIQALSVRDSEVSINLALQQIFGRAKTPRQAQEVTSDLDVDYSMFGHYVVDSIYPQSGSTAELQGMYSNAALADLFFGRIRAQNWKYLKYYFYFMSAGVWSAKQSPFRDRRANFPSSIMALSRTKKVRAIRNSVTLKFGKLTHSSKAKVNAYSLPFIRLYFEELFLLYSSKELESPKGQQLLEIVADIHNEVSLDEDEFIYMFNDPLYEKQTAAEEKKQKALIKIVEAKKLEIRETRIANYNKNINESAKFRSTTNQPPISVLEKSLSVTESPVKQKEDKSTAQMKKSKPKKKTKSSTKSSEILVASEQIDTFDLEEQTVDNEIQDKTPSKTKKSIKSKKLNQDKEKQKNLFDFANEKDSSKDKKKKGSKNLFEFM